MKCYRRITWTDRLIIEKMVNAKHTFTEIARVLGFAVSSISREVKRGLYEHTLSTLESETRYSAKIAQDMSDWAATAKGAPLKLCKEYSYVHEVSQRILSGESPDSIVGSKKRLGLWTVSTASLYSYIDKGFIPGVTNNNLIVKSKRKKRRYSRVTPAARPPKGPSIERRSPDVNSRSEFGHWEMDSVIGKSSGKYESFLVLTERLSRYEIILKQHDKTSKSVVDSLKCTFKNYPSGTFLSLTCDNGSEFQAYDQLKELCPIYYCHPYSSFERGSNENANRLIRRFFPKGQSLKKVTQSDCDTVQNLINSMVRRSLGYRSAYEVFRQFVPL